MKFIKYCFSYKDSSFYFRSYAFSTLTSILLFLFMFETPITKAAEFWFPITFGFLFPFCKMGYDEIVKFLFPHTDFYERVLESLVFRFIRNSLLYVFTFVVARLFYIYFLLNIRKKPRLWFQNTNSYPKRKRVISK